MVATAAAVVAAVTIAVWLWPRPVALPPPVLFNLPAPDGGPYLGSPRSMAISPDGRRVAFVAGSVDQRRLWIRPLDSLVAQPLTGTEDAHEPAWSPDGRTLAFSASRSSGAASVAAEGVSLKRVDVAGGPVITLASAAPDAPAWSPSGIILVAGVGRKGLYRLSDKGGSPSLVMELEASRQETELHSPVFLPDGRRFLFSATSSDRKKSALLLASLDTPGRTHVIDVESSVGYAEGHLVYQQDGVLMARPFDEQRGQVTGDAVPIAASVQRDRIGRGAFSLSADGTLLYRPALVVGLSRLTWFDSSGRITGEIGGLERNTDAGHLSPDRAKVVVTRNDGRSSDVWMVDLARGVPSRLTFDPGPDSAPTWFPSGDEVLWRSDRNGKIGIYRRAISGDGGDQLIFESSQNLFP
jgi:Tol biopolymer transport system component